jgi:predicted alpha/beta-fold hydrolase
LQTLLLTLQVLLALLCFPLQDLPADAPVLILFPGLTGGSGDSYVQHAVLQARHAGIRAAVFNSRGTADSPVLTPQFYSASFTGDTREVRCNALQYCSCLQNSVTC